MKRNGDLHVENEHQQQLAKNGDLLRATIDSSMDMIQVFKAVRDERGDIVDFIWILNNKASEAVYGDVIGQSLLTLNRGLSKKVFSMRSKRWSQLGFRSNTKNIIHTSNSMAGSINPW